MEDLIEFLNARWDDEERVARGAATPLGWTAATGTGEWASSDDRGYVWDEGVDDEDNAREVVADEGVPTVAQAAHIAAWDPARVLAEIEVKRQLLGWLHPVDRTGMASILLRTLAVPYAGREDFRPEWRL